MLEDIYSILAKHNVKILYAPFHKEAFYDPKTNNIYISSSVTSEIRKKNLILHEAGHVLLHYGEFEMYKHCQFAHRKMEHEANVYRIDNLVREYIAEYGVDHEVNIYDFMNCNKISFFDEYDVRSAFDSEDRKIKEM